MGYERWFVESDAYNNVIDLALAHKALCSKELQCSSSPPEMPALLPLRTTAALPSPGGTVLHDGAIVALNNSATAWNATLVGRVAWNASVARHGSGRGGVRKGSAATALAGGSGGGTCRVEWRASTESH